MSLLLSLLLHAVFGASLRMSIPSRLPWKRNIMLSTQTHGKIVCDIEGVL
jgi:hypothetical protein